MKITDVEVNINGIMVMAEDDYSVCVGFYSVFDENVNLDACYITDEDRDEELDSKNPQYNFFKEIEKDLTEKHGHKYCCIHSRKLDGNFCDVCSFELEDE